MLAANAAANHMFFDCQETKATKLALCVSKFELICGFVLKKKKKKKKLDRGDRIPCVLHGFNMCYWTKQTK